MGGDEVFSRADAYERFMGRWSRLLAPMLVDFAEVCDGDTLLDVGSGTGALSFAIRDATRTSIVVGVDPSRDYVTYATQQNTDPRVRFEIGNAMQLPFDEATFDRTLSLLVVNFIPDPAKALSEMVRATKPGGVVAAAVWDYGCGMQMLRMFWDEATALEPRSAARDEANMPGCRERALPALWRERGLENVDHAPLTVPQHFASFDDFWSPFLLGQGPAGAYVAALSGDHQAALAKRLRMRLLGGGLDGAFELSARAWAVKGWVRT